MRRIGKYVWIFIKSILILILISYTSTASIEHIEKDILVSRFKRNAVYQEDISTNRVKYYKVSGNEKRNSFDTIAKGDCYPGTSGDIVCSLQQNTILPVVNEIVSFYAGGHAGYVMEDYADYEIRADITQSVETTITNPSSLGTAQLFNRYDWSTNEYFQEVFALRVNIEESKQKEVNSLITARIGDLYNKSFIFNTENTSYCTDLISKAYKQIGINLNRDGFTTSVYDLIVSKDTYISYYHYFDSQGIKYVYYLG